MDVDIGYVDSWQIRDAKDVHPSHITAVIEVKHLMFILSEARDMGLFDDYAYQWFKKNFEKQAEVSANSSHD